MDIFQASFEWEALSCSKLTKLCFDLFKGLDFAIYRNGYVYHTQSDVSEKVPLGTYQNIGDNILSIAKAIANAAELSDPKVSTTRQFFFKSNT